MTGSSVTHAQCELHEVAKITASDADGYDYFGYPVSISEDVVIVGANRDDCTAGSDCGSAYIYRFNGINWIQQIKLAVSDAVAFDHFGSFVSVSGDVAVVGAYGDDCAAGLGCGSAYVYRFNGSTWVEEQKLTASDAAASDLFGWSVSVSGDIAIVGAPYSDCVAGSGCGAAYVYRFNGSTWAQQAKLTASDTAAFDSFGRSVSVSGDAAIVGSFWDDCATGSDCGSAYVYRFNGSVWIEEAKLTALDAAQGDHFGHSVSVSGDVVAVGTTSDDCASGSNCGSTYVYRFNGSAWVEEAKLTAMDAVAFDYFGRSVSVSGDAIIVGAEQGAYVYQFNPGAPGHWILRAMPVASDGDFYDSFGSGVSVSGNTAIVGAFYDDCRVPQGSTYLGCGSAYVFALENVLFDCNANGIPDEADIAGGTSQDCDANGVPDECDILSCPGDPALDDCNANLVPDGCDIASGSSRDCNVNGIPDECETQADCNNNGTQDICDVAEGMSLDCNGDKVPDECQRASNDCNGNLIPDDCESSRDCNNNTIRDFCDIADGTSLDCNANVAPDDCDLADGTSTDVNNNEIPDECDTDLPPFIIEQPVDVTACGPETVVFKVFVGGMTPLIYQWRKDTVDLDGKTSDTLTLTGVTEDDAGNYDVVVTNDLGSIISDQAALVLTTLGDILPDPTGVAKNRYLSLIPPTTPCKTAIRVKMVELQNPNPPNVPVSPPPNFSPYESGTCTAAGEENLCARWVGKPSTFLETQDQGVGGGTYRAARLQCTSYYLDWSAEGLIHVTGAEIIPSSIYTVEMVQAACMGIEDTCTAVSAPLTITTSRSGDLSPPFQEPSPAPLSQPDVLDITQLVYKYAGIRGAPVKAIAQLQPNVPELNADINALDIVAVVNAFKQFAYPFSGPCPCPSAVPCGIAPCSSTTPCVTEYGAGATCVKTCTDGDNAGDPCINNSHCPGGTCGAGFCRDRCGRCSP